MASVEYRTGKKQTWEGVRPVVIYFAGERLIVNYDDYADPATRPLVAMVHSYLENVSLAKHAN